MTLQFELTGPVKSKMGSVSLTLPANTNETKTLPFTSCIAGARHVTRSSIPACPSRELRRCFFLANTRRYVMIEERGPAREVEGNHGIPGRNQS